METTVSTAKAAPASSAGQLLAAHPLIAYFVIAYAGSWLVQLPMLLGKQGLGLLPYNVPLPIYIVLFLLSSYSGPTLAALLVTNAMEGREGVRQFLRRYRQWRVGLPWYLLAVFGLPLIYIVAITIRSGSFPAADLAAHWPTFFTLYLPALLIFPAFITWGEEPGWRGFALTHMQERYHPLLSALVVGFLHGFWHLPIFILVSGPPAQGPFSPGRFITNLFGIMVLTILWAWAFNNARGSILIAVLLHASSNATQGWIGQLIPNQPKGAGQIALIIYIASALVLIVATRGLLGYKSIGSEKRQQ